MTIKKIRAILWRARIIRRLLEQGHTVNDLVPMLKVSRRTIYHVQEDARYWHRAMSNDVAQTLVITPELKEALEGHRM